VKVGLIRIGIIRWDWLFEKGCCGGILLECIAQKIFVQLFVGTVTLKFWTRKSESRELPQTRLFS